MSMWAAYKKERLGVETIERDHGFLCYKILDEECFIDEIYIKPEYRMQHHASDLAAEVSVLAVEQGCKWLSCTVQLSSHNATDALKAILAYGFRLQSADSNVILLVKELTNG